MNLVLDLIEVLLDEIERVDQQSRGQFRQAEDREIYDLVCRIERKMKQSVKAEAAS